MDKNITIILDPAHGVDVAGKRSPDGKHLEYRWSRERVNSITTLLKNLGYDVYTTNPTDKEIGLSARRNFATALKSNKPKIFLSLHNNAAGAGGAWLNARGYSVYTTKGVTRADSCAEIILKHLERDFPELKVRRYSNTPLNGDFEENFSVLVGNGYYGVLIEWLFQDNVQDVELLKDPKVNKRFEESLIKSIEEINEYFGN